MPWSCIDAAGINLQAIAGSLFFSNRNIVIFDWWDCPPPTPPPSRALHHTPKMWDLSMQDTSKRAQIRIRQIQAAVCIQCIVRRRQQQESFKQIRAANKWAVWEQPAACFSGSFEYPFFGLKKWGLPRKGMEMGMWHGISAILSVERGRWLHGYSMVLRS